MKLLTPKLIFFPLNFPYVSENCGRNGKLHSPVFVADLREVPQIKNCSPRASGNFPDDFFTWEEKREGYIVCQIIIALYAFGALAMVCSYYFMSSLEKICKSELF